jgi:hypothetical protein
MKEIEFISGIKDVEKFIDAPKPSSHFIPEWYKQSSRNITDEKGPFHYNGGFNKTFKQCTPMLDSIMSGYTFGLASDVYALEEEKYNGVRLSWGKFPETVAINDHSQDQLQKYPKINKYDEIFKWNFWWKIKTPPGYSCLFTHPRHRNDLPFITIDAIVDTDSYNSIINFPFFLNKDFTGKINKGTPIVQIFPFKRDSWKSKYREFDEQIVFDTTKNFSILEGMYKKFFWKRKEYR